MAQKKITDYQLISAITGTVNFFVDNLTQNYRATAEQIKDFVLSTGNVITSVIADGAVTTDKIADGAVTSAKANFTKITIQRFTSGSGTYTTPAGVKWLRVRMAGGGAGGTGSGTGAGTGGTAGNTTFGSSLLTAGGGGSGNTVNSPAVSVVNNVGAGAGYRTELAFSNGGIGGPSFFGGSGQGGGGQGNGGNAQANTGAGGGGAGGFAGSPGAGGGAAGGYIEAIILAPSATYSYSVGTGGTGGTAGSGGTSGGNGAAGIIIVEEYYQ